MNGNGYVDGNIQIKLAILSSSLNVARPDHHAQIHIKAAFSYGCFNLN